MRKKLFTIICTLSLVASFLPNISVNAVNTGASVEQAEELLIGLNIYNQEEITRDSFIYSLAGFLFDSTEGFETVADIAKAIRAIGSDEIYPNETKITLIEAIKYAVRVLGYQLYANQNGGYPEGYRQTAVNIGLLNGINTNDNTTLNKEDAVRLLYNMIEIEPLVQNFVGGSASYSLADGENMLSLHRDIREIKGVLVSDSQTSIYTENVAITDGYCLIDDTSYIAPANSVKELLGRNVVAYVQKTKTDEEKILYIGEKKGRNDSLSIDAEDIIYVSDDLSTFEYEIENGRIDKINIPAALRMIYNGSYLSGYTKADLKPEVGNVTFLDNNNDGIYDFVFVTSYKTVVVESINPDDKTIKNRYNFEGSIKNLNIDENDDIKCKIYKNGSEIEINDIKINDILSVAKSKSTVNQVVEIYVSTAESFTGYVTSKYTEENTIGVDGYEYKISDELTKFMLLNSKEIKIGNSYMLYLDCFGNVVYFKSETDRDYKVVYKFYQDESEEVYYVQYMNMDGEWIKSELAERVKLDDDLMKAEYAYIQLKDISPQIMVMQENNEGKIKSILRAQTDMIDEDKFTKKSEMSYIYRSGPKSLNMQIYLENDAQLVIFPEDLRDKTGYTVYKAQGLFSADKTYYNIAAYDMDKYGFTHLLSMKEDASTKETFLSGNFFAVQSIGVTVNADDDVVPYVKGSFGACLDFTLIGTKSDVFDGIVPGDIINIHTNNAGMVDHAKKVYSLTNFQNVDSSNLYGSRVIVAGTIQDVDTEKLRCIINCGSDKSFSIPATVAVLDYDTQNGRKQFDISSTSSLRPQDRIVCRFSQGVLAEIVRVK